ncbi:MAG TPA: hypothetical protein VEX70_00970 [Pyrinomonadaceae bacterium]|nr:hypothetical protein [Pyrinomonadaceae bacterium]
MTDKQQQQQQLKMLNATRDQQLRQFEVPEQLHMPGGLDEIVNSDLSPQTHAEVAKRHAAIAALIAQTPHLEYVSGATDLVEGALCQKNGRTFIYGLDIVKIRRIARDQHAIDRHYEDGDAVQFAACVEAVLSENMGAQYNEAADLTPDLVVYSDIYPIGDE